jgi:hypothetical protein
MSSVKDIGTITTPRDLAILRTLAAARVLDAEQIGIVGGFTSLRRTNRRLLKLVNAGLLRRWFVGTEMRGVKAIYGLSPRGASLIGESSHVLIPWKQERVITSSQFLAHQQAVNEIFLRTRFQPLGAEASCERWMTFREQLAPSLPLRPDAYFEIKNAGSVYPMFLEADLGNETSTVWKGKVELYLNLALNGEFERQFHEKRFRVLVLFHSSRRLEVIRKTIASRTDKLFWLSTQDQVRSEGLLASIWLRPNAEQRIPLL